MYADVSVTSAYLDVIEKLNNAKLLNKELSRKYRTEIKEYATKEVRKCLWWYKRISLRLFLLGNAAYKCYRSSLAAMRGCCRFMSKLFKG